MRQKHKKSKSQLIPKPAPSHQNGAEEEVGRVGGGAGGVVVVGETILSPSYLDPYRAKIHTKHPSQ